MIDFYTWSTPNGRKISIMLEECGLPYTVHKVDITKNEQFKPDFLKVSPNNKIPGIVDREGPGGKPYACFESGAILLYLADKAGKFLPEDKAARFDAIQWLMWQMGGFGPMLGQTHHFVRFASEQVPYAIKRFSEETARLYGVLDKRLAEHAYTGGADYTVADMAIYPWAARHEWHRIDLAAFPNVRRWYDEVGARPAVKKGMAVPA
ncbi:MAG: glutathione S-transferase N-terminal domain-containing protein [Rhodospirillales bacterium]|nr:MAG: glutathione S-transferase N-terminal domain-containing protein [Rhodospirillales bacterium]